MAKRVVLLLAQQGSHLGKKLRETQPIFQAGGGGGWGEGDRDKGQ